MSRTLPAPEQRRLERAAMDMLARTAADEAEIASRFFREGRHLEGRRHLAAAGEASVQWETLKDSRRDAS